ncbi:MAG: hypothetical protein HWN81_00525 [Candidatus Lokiarchaeota archaeon]|nr:hypothetical protein [Candidatus Lokiarchaeota archaeon]
MKVLMGNSEYRLFLHKDRIGIERYTYNYNYCEREWSYYSSLTDRFDDFLEFKKDMNKKKDLFINFGCQRLELDKACELYVLLEDYFKYLLEE